MYRWRSSKYRLSYRVVWLVTLGVVGWRIGAARLDSDDDDDEDDDDESDGSALFGGLGGRGGPRGGPFPPGATITDGVTDAYVVPDAVDVVARGIGGTVGAMGGTVTLVVA
jgi:hypothetical protein